MDKVWICSCGKEAHYHLVLNSIHKYFCEYHWSKHLGMDPKPEKDKKVTPKSLQNDCEELWKEIIEKRDGRECMVKKHFPLISTRHTEVYQADHCFTRKNKNLFLEVSNGTMLCSGCNMAKHYDNKSVKRAVDYIVMSREGMKIWNKMLKIDMSMSANVNWGKMWWLEKQKKRLARILSKMKKREISLPLSHSPLK